MLRKPSQADLERANSREGGDVKIIALFALCLATLIAMIVVIGSRWPELRGAGYPSGTILLQMGAGELAWYSALTIGFSVAIVGEVAAAILFLPSRIKAWWRDRQSKGFLAHIMSDIGGGIILFLLVISPPLVVWAIGCESICSANVAIDESGDVMSVQRRYLLRSEEGLQIRLSEIDYISYTYDPPHPTGGGGGVAGASGTVTVVKLGGDRIQISSGDPKRHRDLARAIAEAIGKDLESH